MFPGALVDNMCEVDLERLLDCHNNKTIHMAIHFHERVITLLIVFIFLKDTNEPRCLGTLEPTIRRVLPTLPIMHASADRQIKSEGQSLYRGT